LPALIPTAHRLLILVNVLVLASSPVAAQAVNAEARALFESGNALFAEARAHAESVPTERATTAKLYRKAASKFIASWKADASTVETFVNTANSFYFAGDTGEAVLYYRRALALEPTSKEAHDALAHIRAALPIGKPTGGATGSLLRALFFWHESLSTSFRRRLFMALFPAAFACFAVALWRGTRWRRFGWVLSSIAVLLLGSLAAESVGGSLRRDAVVLVEVAGRRGDGETYSPSHSAPFPAGTEVRIRENRGGAASSSSSDWIPIELLDGSESWIPANTTQPVLADGL